jgi:hypothetical protein
VYGGERAGRGPAALAVAAGLDGERPSHSLTAREDTMNATALPYAMTLVLVMSPLLAGCNREAAAAPQDRDAATSLAPASRTIPVSGSAVHYVSTGIIHSQQPTSNGMIQRSTEIVRLSGDLVGYALYHPTSTFDYTANTLVNTGTQFFSGTIAGSEPVVLHDDKFRFTIDLATGEDTGEVHLSRSKDAPDQGRWYECNLHAVGTGQTPAGDNLSDYTGECIRHGNAK